MKQRNNSLDGTHKSRSKKYAKRNFLAGIKMVEIYIKAPESNISINNCREYKEAELFG